MAQKASIVDGYCSCSQTSEAEAIGYRVTSYVSGLLVSFPRETLNKVVHEILINYPQSEYVKKNERPILNQRCGGGETWES